MPVHQVGEFCSLVRMTTSLECSPAMLAQMEAAGILPTPDRSTQAPGGNRLYSDEIHLARACLARILRSSDLKYAIIRRVVDQIDARPQDEAEVFWAAFTDKARATQVLQLLELRVARLVADDLVSWVGKGTASSGVPADNPTRGDGDP